MKRIKKLKSWSKEVIIMILCQWKKWRYMSKSILKKWKRYVYVINWNWDIVRIRLMIQFLLENKLKISKETLKEIQNSV